MIVPVVRSGECNYLYLMHNILFVNLVVKVWDTLVSRVKEDTIRRVLKCHKTEVTHKEGQCTVVMDRAVKAGASNNYIFLHIICNIILEQKNDTGTLIV